MYERELMIVILVGLVTLTGYMALLSFSDSVVCILGSDCGFVQESQYGEIFGVNVSLFGFVSFSVLLILSFFGFRRGSKSYNIYFLLTVIGAGFAIYFLFLQFFVLEKLCTNCIIIDLLMIVIFVLNAVYLLRNRKQKY